MGTLDKSTIENTTVNIPNLVLESNHETPKKNVILSSHFHSRKSSSLQNLNNRKNLKPHIPLLINRNMQSKYQDKKKVDLKCSNIRYLNSMSFEQSICENHSRPRSKASSASNKKRSNEQESNEDSLEWLILNVSSLSYNGFEVHDPVSSMLSHFDTYVPLDSERNHRYCYNRL